jgi:hypothetical protein
MIEKQIIVDIKKILEESRQAKVNNLWRDPRERFNNTEINKMKKNNCLNYLLVILIIATVFFLIKVLNFSF